MASIDITPRDQRIVAALARVVPATEVAKDTKDELRKEAARLPSMFQRHGPLQVFLYLAGKSDSELKVGQWVWTVFCEIREDSPLAKARLFGAGAKREPGVVTDLFKAVSVQPIEQRLLDQAICAEIATWLYRTLVAMRALAQKEEG